MRLHTNGLTVEDLHKATGHLPGVYVHATEHGSRSHARAFEVRLEGNGYRRNSGQYGAGNEYGAAWNEWGAFLGYLYALDPYMLCGSAKYPVYRDAGDFSFQTGRRFDAGDGTLPEDIHKRHTWKFEGVSSTGAYSLRSCKKCSAISRTAVNYVSVYSR